MLPLAIYYARSAYSLEAKLMGRQSAGAGFMQAVANLRLPRLWCYAASRQSAQDCAQTLAVDGAPQTGVDWVPFEQPQRLSEAGLLYRPDPRIEVDAWQRLAHSAQRSYSLCGITHTISTHAVMESIATWLTAPLEPWDAVICTSTAGRKAIQFVLEQMAEHLRDRLGASRFTLPQFPVIPLGVHTGQFSFTPDQKQAARLDLGIAPDEVAVLFAGRLAIHGKAHPLPMYLALERAAAGRKIVLVQAGTAPTEPMLRVFTDEPRKLCPSVRIVMVDGKDADRYRSAWAASDIFTSLSDNIQETFGITPIEAMAAGLPVVVSDWDGYKDTVRDGMDGFRVPTLTPPAGFGTDLAERYNHDLDNYDVYIGNVSQLTAVDVDAAYNAYERLLSDQDLRRRMGETAQRHARETFDWSRVMAQYQALWADLNDRRESSAALYPPLPQRRSPSRPDPFSMFAGYSTGAIKATTRFRLCAGASLDMARERRDLGSISFATAVLPGLNLINAIVSTLDPSNFQTTEAIARANPGIGHQQLARALVWLVKCGILQHQAS